VVTNLLPHLFGQAQMSAQDALGSSVFQAQVGRESFQLLCSGPTGGLCLIINVKSLVFGQEAEFLGSFGIAILVPEVSVVEVSDLLAGIVVYCRPLNERYAVAVQVVDCVAIQPSHCEAVSTKNRARPVPNIPEIPPIPSLNWSDWTGTASLAEASTLYAPHDRMLTEGLRVYGNQQVLTW
jgi:hypothetical protein